MKIISFGLLVVFSFTQTVALARSPEVKLQLAGIWSDDRLAEAVDQVVMQIEDQESQTDDTPESRVQNKFCELESRLGKVDRRIERQLSLISISDARAELEAAYQKVEQDETMDGEQKQYVTQTLNEWSQSTEEEIRTRLVTHYRNQVREALPEMADGMVKAGSERAYFQQIKKELRQQAQEMRSAVKNQKEASRALASSDSRKLLRVLMITFLACWVLGVFFTVVVPIVGLFAFFGYIGFGIGVIALFVQAGLNRSP